MIYNWFDDGFVINQNKNCFHAHRKDFNKFTVAYGGNIGIAQGLNTVLEAAELLKYDKEIEFLIAGDGIEKAKLVFKCKTQKLENIRFYPRMPQDEMGHFLSNADVLLVSLSKDKKYEITIPSKMYSYLALGKPVLGVVSGDSAKMIEDLQVGLVSNPGDANALVNTIIEFKSMIESELKRYGKNAVEAYIAKYSKEIQIMKYVKVFESTIANN